LRAVFDLTQLPQFEEKQSIFKNFIGDFGLKMGMKLSCMHPKSM
jgi:hypothetical protein